MEEDQQNKEKPVFNISLGTVLRVNNCFDNVDILWRNKDYKNLFHEYELIIRNLKPLFYERNKKTKLRIADLKYKTDMLDIKTKCLIEFSKCEHATETGINFMPTITLVLLLEELDDLLREVAYINKLYMISYDDEDDGGSVLMRKPRVNWGARM